MAVGLVHPGTGTQSWKHIENPKNEYLAIAT